MVEEPGPPRSTGIPGAERRGITWTPRLILWTVILVLLLIFVLQNFDGASVNILFWDIKPPLAVILLIFGAAGYVLGWLRPRFRSHRRS
jgi:uncharacterized integral membrane protein